MYISRFRSADEVIFESDHFEMNDGLEVRSDDWFLESAKSQKGFWPVYGLKRANHSFVQITYVIRRQSEAYIYQVFIPTLIMSCINLVLLWLDPIFYDRLLLLIINLFSHEVYLEQLHYM